MKGRLSHVFRILGLALMLASSFLAGVTTTRLGWVPGVQPAAAAGIEADLPIFWEAWSLIRRRFIDQAALDSTQLSYAAIQGVVEALGDSGHTRFLTPAQAQQHQSSIDGHFIGIGAQLGYDYAGQPIIVRPYEGSPARRSGLRSGDMILAVDGVDVTKMDLEDITGLIWGQAGTNVILSVMHRRDREVVEVIVPREEMEIPVVTWAFVPNSRIAYLSLSQFSSRSNQELKQALTEVQASEATGLIVDVRGNPGGLLSQAISISSQFLNGGAVMQETNAWGDMRTFAAEVGGVAPEIPLVVLVDRGSASSAEIFAGAMQDNERGLVIGETTFGTGTVLTPFTLSDGSILLLGTSEWLTAHGRSIRNEGILPDVVVDLADDGIILSPSDIDQMTEEELLRMNDETLLEAIKVLKNCYRMHRCRDVIQDKLVITR